MTSRGKFTLRIAVIGSGIAGMGAAWLLSKRHDVVVFEKNAHIGGHSNTVEVEEIGGSVPVDTGFIVYNTACYPNLIALFEHLQVPTATTEMSFAVSLDDGRFEYNGNGVFGLFGQPRNVLRPSHWRMTFDILRFFREASALDLENADPEMSLGQWLDDNGYSEPFTRRHILPMAAAIWSTPADEMLAFPIAAFARFFRNHGLLQVADRPEWRTVQGGSREYVRRLKASSNAIWTASDPVTSVERQSPSGVTVTCASGRIETFDQCVMATHADEALALLADRDDVEQQLLAPFRYEANEAVLHTDAALMPKRRRLWTSWNYMGASGDDARLSVTYWMNCLQPLPTQRDYFVTLNPHRPIDPNTIIRTIGYHHPVYDAAAMTAQSDLWSLQGRRSTWYAGSYFGYGFHEDALQAGLAVAEDLGGLQRPWQVADPRGRILSPAAQQATTDWTPAQEAAE